MEKISIAAAFVAGLFVVAGPPAPAIAAANIEWTLNKQLDLEATPLDVSPSANGATIFVLTPGEVLVYMVATGEVTNRIPVDKSFDRIAYSARNNSLILSSSWERALIIIRLENVYDISISDTPFQGPEDAPVVIAVFNDYQ